MNFKFTQVSKYLYENFTQFRTVLFLFRIADISRLTCFRFVRFHMRVCTWVYIRILMYAYM
jgi:hypothetical protein